MAPVSGELLPPPFRGILLGESLRPGTVVDRPPVNVRRIWRAEAGDPNAGQPPVWTFIEFEVADALAGDLAQVLSGTLSATGGWYCSFASDDEMIVVFAGRSFRYRRGDDQARREVEDHARSVGVPEAQLDWETWEGPPHGS
jgi:hypothetical protein